MIDYSRFPQEESKRKRKKFPILISFIVILSSLYLLVNQVLIDQNKKRVFVSPLAKDLIEKSTAFLNPEKNSSSLEELVQNELKSEEGDYSVAIKNLKTGERYYFNEQKVFDAASLYKLFVMGAVFQKIEAGGLTKEKTLSQKIPILNQKFRISSDSAELKEGSITLPVQSALTRMITISDNYSALLLAENVRLSNVSSFLQKHSLNGSRVGTRGETPATTAEDMTSFFEMLYEGKIASESSTLDMIALLKGQRLNSKLPKYLPKNTVVAHKTGELGRLSHDAGIVYTQKGDYIIVVLTDTPRPIDANEKIAEISKKVYSYFTNKN